MNHYTKTELSGFYRTLAQKDSFLLKASTTVLTKGTEVIHESKIEDLANQAAALYDQKKKVGLVTSGARQTGRAVLENDLGMQYSLHLDQALSSIGQPDLMEGYRKALAMSGLFRGQILLEYDHMIAPEKIANIKNTIEALNQLKAIPIFNENDVTSVDEIVLEENGSGTGLGKRIGDNDVLSAKAAYTFGYEVLFMLTELDGFLYNGSGSKFHVVDEITSLWDHVSEKKSHRTKGGMTSKLKAIEEATANGIYVCLLSGMEENVILRALEGEPLGTLFLPKNYKNKLEQ